MTQNEKNVNLTKAPDNKNVKKATNKPNQTHRKVGLFSLFFAIFFLLYEIANIILYFVISYNRSKGNGERSTLFLTFHILLHSFIILFDISLFLIAFRNFLKNCVSALPLISFSFLLIGLVFYVTYILAILVETKQPKNQITFDKLQDILENTTISNVFFYSKGSKQTEQYSFNPATGQQTRVDGYTKCYSNSGLLLPLKSHHVNERYNFLNTPKYFYFQIIVDLNMSKEFQSQYYQTISQIRSCNHEKIQIRFLPQINKTFIVGNQEIPKFLTSKYRMIAAVLGAGFYYDEYTKSIPFIVYKPKINVDVDPDFDFSKLWAKKWCIKYGKCDVNNQKPRPNIDDL